MNILITNLAPNGTKAGDKAGRKQPIIKALKHLTASGQKVPKWLANEALDYSISEPSLFSAKEVQACMDSILNTKAPSPATMNKALKSNQDVPMSRRRAKLLADYANRLAEMLESAPDDKDLAEWVQSKIDRAAYAIQSAYHYLEHDELEKGAGHLYDYKKFRGYDKHGRKRWEYFYHVHRGKTGITGAAEDTKAGDAFKLKDPQSGQAGHFHVKAVKGSVVVVEHDETGRSVTMTKSELKALLMKEHGQALKENFQAKKETYERMKRDTPKHIGLKAAFNRLQAAADKAGIKLPATARERYASWYREQAAKQEPNKEVGALMRTPEPVQGQYKPIPPKTFTGYRRTLNTNKERLRYLKNIYEHPHNPSRLNRPNEFTTEIYAEVKTNLLKDIKELEDQTGEHTFKQPANSRELFTRVKRFFPEIEAIYDRGITATIKVKAGQVKDLKSKLIKHPVHPINVTGDLLRDILLSDLIEILRGEENKAAYQAQSKDNFETMPEPVQEPASQPAARAQLIETPEPVQGPAPQPAKIDNFELAEHTHTKTGVKLFTAKQKDRVDRDEFKRRVQIAKKYKGRYDSRYAKAYLFKNAEDARKFALEVEGKPTDSPTTAPATNNFETMPEAESVDNFETMPGAESGTTQRLKEAHSLLKESLEKDEIKNGRRARASINADKKLIEHIQKIIDNDFKDTVHPSDTPFQDRTPKQHILMEMRGSLSHFKNEQTLLRGSRQDHGDIQKERNKSRRSLRTALNNLEKLSASNFETMPESKLPPKGERTAEDAKKWFGEPTYFETKTPIGTRRYFQYEREGLRVQGGPIGASGQLLAGTRTKVYTSISLTPESRKEISEAQASQMELGEYKSIDEALSAAINSFDTDPQKDFIDFQNRDLQRDRQSAARRMGLMEQRQQKVPARAELIESSDITTSDKTDGLKGTYWDRNERPEIKRLLDETASRGHYQARFQTGYTPSLYDLKQVVQDSDKLKLVNAWNHNQTAHTQLINFAEKGDFDSLKALLKDFRTDYLSIIARNSLHNGYGKLAKRIIRDSKTPAHRELAKQEYLDFEKEYVARAKQIFEETRTETDAEIIQHLKERYFRHKDRRSESSSVPQLTPSQRAQITKRFDEAAAKLSASNFETMPEINFSEPRQAKKRKVFKEVTAGELYQTRALIDESEVRGVYEDETLASLKKKLEPDRLAAESGIRERGLLQGIENATETNPLAKEYKNFQVRTVITFDRNNKAVRNERGNPRGISDFIREKLSLNTIGEVRAQKEEIGKIANELLTLGIGNAVKRTKDTAAKRKNKTEERAISIFDYHIEQAQNRLDTIKASNLKEDEKLKSGIEETIELTKEAKKVYKQRSESLLNEALSKNNNQAIIDGLLENSSTRFHFTITPQGPAAKKLTETIVKDTLEQVLKDIAKTSLEPSRESEPAPAPAPEPIIKQGKDLQVIKEQLLRLESLENKRSAAGRIKSFRDIQNTKEKVETQIREYIKEHLSEWAQRQLSANDNSTGGWISLRKPFKSTAKEAEVQQNHGTRQSYINLIEKMREKYPKSSEAQTPAPAPAPARAQLIETASDQSAESAAVRITPSLSEERLTNYSSELNPSEIAQIYDRSRFLTVAKETPTKTLMRSKKQRAIDNELILMHQRLDIHAEKVLGPLKPRVTQAHKYGPMFNEGTREPEHREKIRAKIKADIQKLYRALNPVKKSAHSLINYRAALYKALNGAA